ncbi:MAG: hypothetical protein QGG64_19015 [Candidatus Latescibacteria bacterium]|nr:hypothetical protein [Candidatus Latescibacterota bacterium]
MVPWVLVYALSTIAMNHRSLIDSFYDHKWEAEREMSYPATFSGDIKRSTVAEQILQDLKLEGKYSVGGRLDKSIKITREDPLVRRRITYTPQFQSLKIERQAFRSSDFLVHMHHRRGYDQKYTSDDFWAVSVDFFILSTVLWAASGLWMWWELTVTRLWGGLCIASGIALFGFFLVTI